jgi:hypothetical protein
MNKEQELSKKLIEDYKILLKRNLAGWTRTLYEWKKTIIIGIILNIMGFILGLLIGVQI